MLTIIHDVTSVLSGAVLCTAGLLKLSHRADLASALKILFPFEAKGAREMAALALPWTEILLGALCLLPWRLRPVLIAASLLFLIFLLVSLRIAIGRIDVSCQCFGDHFQAGRWVAAFRGALFFGLSLCALLTHGPGAAPLSERLVAYFMASSVVLIGLIFLHARELRKAQSPLQI